MTVHVPLLRDHRVAGIAALTGAALPGGLSLRIFDGQAPGSITVTPLVVVYSLGPAAPATSSSALDGPIADAFADVDALLQATCLGADPDEAEGAADAVMAIWLDPTRWTIPGRVLRSVPLLESRPATFRDDDPQPSTYLSPVIVRVPTTPA